MDYVVRGWILCGLVLVLCLSQGCASAHKEGDDLHFYGYGRAKWTDGTEIESKSPIALPDIKVK